ncbi:unnamed protein product [Closterium sp. NIES-54]
MPASSANTPGGFLSKADQQDFFCHYLHPNSPTCPSPAPPVRPFSCIILLSSAPSPSPSPSPPRFPSKAHQLDFFRHYLHPTAPEKVTNGEMGGMWEGGESSVGANSFHLMLNHFDAKYLKPPWHLLCPSDRAGQSIFILRAAAAMVLSVALPEGLDASKLSKDISAYSELQQARLKFRPTLPSMLDGPSVVEKGPPTKAAGNDEEIAKLFPSLYGQPSVKLVPAGASAAPTTPITVGVVLSGGQAPGGHNVIAGLFDYLQEKVPGSKLLGFLGGPAGVMKCKYVEITAEFLYPYRNQGGFDIICSGRDKIESPEQFAMAVASAEQLSLDGLVVIGGDDSNTNACLLAEHFRVKGLKTKVIGCPKTIDGDLKAAQVPISFGFDTACKVYSETIGNVMTDARSGGKYYHFVRLMGRAASHITLECALQTHPNITLVGEEVFAKGMTLGQVTNHIADVICKRAEAGKNFGVVLIPEGLIDFIPEINDLISQLNEILAKAAVDAEGMYEWKEGLQPNTRTLFDSLPKDIQDQLLLERDPHGNVQVARIETEKMLISMVEEELGRRAKAGQYKGAFEGRSHFCGYEGRCGMPTLFDATYCYALGSVAAALVQAGETGLIASVGNLTAPPQEWTVGGTALTELMVVERRKEQGEAVDLGANALTELMVVARCKGEWQRGKGEWWGEEGN